jgi:uncharacterized protein
MEVSETLKNRLGSNSSPKRILALDGGGIRGAVTLGFLEEIEKILAVRHAELGIMPKEKFRLHHYFDLIGGTSTGSIIAALLAIGDYTVPQIKEMYLSLGAKIFSDRNGLNLLGKRIYLNRKYDAKPLIDELRKIFGDARLGDNTNKTGFCAVTKRLDTCSTWPVTNNPRAKYFDRNRFFIRDIVRASTAAPSYFEPELIDVGMGHEGVFVDGGMSIMNNPSLQLFLCATLKGFNLNWAQGEDKLFIVSVGTGRRDKKLVGKKYEDPKLWDIAQFAPDQFMNDAGETVELMMNYIGKNVGPRRKIDNEVGDLSDDALNGKNAFTFARYNIEMAKDILDMELGFMNLTDDTVETLMEMDLPQNVGMLTKIGEAAGKAYVKAAHFDKVFDLSKAESERLIPT